MRATSVVARAGYPYAAVVAEGFYPQARAIAKAQGLDSAVIVRYPGVPLSDLPEDFDRRVQDVVVPGVLDGLLTGASAVRAEGDEEYERDQIVASGDLDVIQDL